MRKLLLFGLLFLFRCVPVFGQLQVSDKRYPDSLQNLAQHAGTDSVKAIANFSLSRYWAGERDTLKASYFLAQGKKHIKNSHYLYALYLYSAGTNVAYQNNRTTDAKKYLLKADRIFEYIKTKESNLIRAKLWNNYSILLSRENKEQESVKLILNKVIPLARAAGDPSMEGLAYHAVAVFFDHSAQSEKASTYYKKSISLLESTKTDDIHMARVYNNSARNSMTRDKFDEARLLINKAKLLLKAHTNTPSYIYLCAFESFYLLKVKQYNKSLKALDEGLKIAKALNLDKERTDLLNQKYNLLIAQRNYQEAKDIILEIIKSDDKTFTENKVDHYKQAYESFELLNNLPEAFKWLKKYALLRDSVNKSKLKEEINTLEIKFRTAENQKKIAELNTANQKANLSAKNSRLLNWLFGTTILFILSILFFGIYYYRNQKKRAEQTEAIRLSKAMITGQETERYRIARELHDGLGNILAVVKFNLSDLVIENQTEELAHVIQQLDHSISELRRIAHDMMPEMLISIGLEAALKDLCESLTSQKLTVDYHFIKIENAIPQQTQLAIYRIVQELLTNVVKHAEAKNVLLQCTQNKNIFFITLDDDGKGFNPNLQKEQTGIGLGNIKSRVAYLNGKIEIGPRINQSGTSINIELNVNA
ncbi:sensor histidine kinase [Pedobacter soli]|uniref:histidine kinase n=1 Tax=Pedobacter soli TaxID=390242 RepID=A0A1G6TKD7_9SPHI|nr:sensor histidine kinase [Pedobacter soli]SDD29334.1 Signal transduction histidine kinase [Pedobacter soli]